MTQVGDGFGSLMESKDVIVVACPACGEKLRAEREWIGRRAKCSRCAHRFALAVPEEPAATATESAKERNRSQRESRTKADTTAGLQEAAEAIPAVAAAPEEPELAGDDERGVPSVGDGIGLEGLQARRPHHKNGHRTGERIAIEGEWTDMLGWGRRPVVVEFDPDLDALFSGGEFDPLWPNDGEYVAVAKIMDDTAEYLRSQWSVCYLHHPRKAVVMKMLRLLGDKYRLSVSRSLVDLLGGEDAEIQAEAAGVLWRKGPLEVAHALRQLKESKQDRGAQAILDACPPEYREGLAELYERNFVQWPGQATAVPT